MSTSISLVDAQRRLSLVWLMGALILFGVVSGQALSGAWRDQSLPEKVDHTIGVFQWLFSNIVPNLTLIFGVLAASELNVKLRDRFRRERRSRFFFSVTTGFTVFYLLTVLLFPVIASGFTTAKERIQLLTYAGFVLPVVQGLLTILTGVFFFKSPDEVSGEEGATAVMAEPRSAGDPSSLSGEGRSPR
jgi:hypothetical protein